MSPRQAQSLLRRAVRALRAKPSAPREGTEQLREAAAAAPRAPNAAPTVRARAGGESRLRGMRIQRIRGRDMVDALERAARELGPDALVLSREPAPGGGVTVAFGVPGTQSAPAPLDPGLRDVQRLLQRAGASAEFLERVSRAVVQSGAQGAFAIDAAAQMLGRSVPVAPSPRVGSRGPSSAAHVIAFVGPTGVGKTTTLVKLASRLVQARRRVALVAMDARGIAGRVQLEAYGRLLQAPVSVAEDGAALCRSIESSRHVDALLVDTSGRSPSDAAALQQLAGELASARAREGHAPVLDVYLTLSATAGRASLDETLLGFGQARPTALVLTKFDETRQPAHALEFAASSGRAAAFLCDGADVARHLHRSSADRIADLFLRGRIA